MIDGSALAARAIADASRRDIASEWGGPEPAARQASVPAERRTERRVTVKKP